MEKEYKIIFKKPAKNTNFSWERESFHIGNSHMGATIYGNYKEEIIQLNEKTLWSGGPSSEKKQYLAGNFQDDNYLKKINEALINNDRATVNKLSKKLIGKKEGYGSFKNFGSILLNFKHTNIKKYKRELNISNAIVNVEYLTNSKKFKSEHFANFEYNVLVSKFFLETNNLTTSISFKKSFDNQIVEYLADSIKIHGEIKDNKLKYFAKILIKTDGETEISNKYIIKDASYIILYTNIQTNYENIFPKYRNKKTYQEVENLIKKASNLAYDDLLKNHLNQYSKLFNTNQISLSKNEYKKETRELLKLYKSNTISNDQKNYLFELLYQFGRYILISSSQGKTLPANLQGVWNNSNKPIWGSDYHLNINLQMCYFPTYKTNLIECSLPLIDYINSLVIPGNLTYKTYYKEEYEKDNRGFVCHTQNTPFGWTCPGWDFFWGWSPACSAWILKDVFDYYLYTLDKKFLKENIYNVLKEGTYFYINTLLYDDNNKRYISSPTYSPEHGPITSGNTYENTIIYNLFLMTKKAALILNDDKSFIKILDKYIDNLKPIEINKFNLIKEWYDEDKWFKNKIERSFLRKKYKIQKGHRHISNLLFVYPLCNFDKKDKLLKEAIKNTLKDRKTLFYRKDTGWSKMHKALVGLQIKETKEVSNLINSFIKKNIAFNLVDLHPPFQIDGNLAFTDLIAESLLYSNDEYIELLPCLLETFKEGNVKGLLAKNAYLVDISWKKKQVTEFKISSDINKKVKIYVNKSLKNLFPDKLNQIIEIDVNNII